MRNRLAFTLIELMVVVAIIAILVALSIPVYGKLRGRAQRAQCMANLKSLHVGAELYLQDNNQWPQIPLGGDDEASEHDYAAKWREALKTYQLEAKTFICPTVQNLLGNPDYVSAGAERVDYMATPFDDKPTTPHQWPRQPWFVEVGDVHGNGNLIIFTDGSISDLKTVAATAGGK